MPTKGSRTGIYKACVKCKRRFYVHTAHIDRDYKFCSRACYLESFKKHSRACATCRKVFVVGEKEKRRKYCSPACYGKSVNGRVLSDSSRRKVSESKLGEKHPLWNGGIQKARGRIFVLSRNHPSSKKSYRYIPRARIVVEKVIGRTLKQSEPVHHINKKKHDDRKKNLMAFSSNSAHHRFHGNPDNVKACEIVFDGRNL